MFFFENLILSGPFIEDLKLFCPADLFATNGLPPVNDMSVNDIRKLLGTYFNIAPPNLENENIVFLKFNSYIFLQNFLILFL